MRADVADAFRRPRISVPSADDLAWVPLPPWALGLLAPVGPVRARALTAQHPKFAAPALPPWWPPEVPVMHCIVRGERAGLRVPRHVGDTLGLVMSRRAPALIRLLGEIAREGGSIRRFSMIAEITEAAYGDPRTAALAAEAKASAREAACLAVLSALGVEASPEAGAESDD